MQGALPKTKNGTDRGLHGHLKSEGGDVPAMDSAILSLDRTLWIAIHTIANRELSVARSLVAKGYAAYVPMSNCRVSHSRVSRLPLFPGYLFCELDPERQGRIVTTPGVAGIVSVGGNPALVAEAEIQAIRRVCESNSEREPWQYLRTGCLVRIDSGPLCGIEGIVVQQDAPRRIVVSVTLLQRSTAVHLDESTRLVYL
jgi:transcription termination/antitermination protein NusG